MTPSTPYLVAAANGLIYRATSSAGPWTVTGISQAGALSAPGYGMSCFQNGYYVVVDGQGVIRRSSDSTTWTVVSPSVDAAQAIAVMRGTNNNVMDPQNLGVDNNYSSLYSVGGYFCLHNEYGNVISKDGLNWFTVPYGSTSGSSSTDWVSPLCYDLNTNKFFFMKSGLFYYSGSDPTISSSWVGGNGLVPTTPSKMYMPVLFGMGSQFYAATADGAIWGTTSTAASPPYTRAWTKQSTMPENPMRGQFIGGTYIIFTDRPGYFYAGSSGSALSRYNFSTVRTTGSTFGIVLADKYIAFGQYQATGYPFVPDIQQSTTLLSGYAAANPTTIPTTGGDVLFPSAYAFPYSAPTSVLPSGGTITDDTPGLSAVVARFPGDEVQRVEWQLDKANTFNTASLITVKSAWISPRTSPPTMTATVSGGDPLSSNGTWYIRARAVGYSGAATPYSAISSFTVTLATMPVPTGVSVTALNDYWPDFHATIVAVTGYAFYAQWQISTNNTFTNIVQTYQTGTAVASGAVNSPKVGVALTAGTYYMRARAVSTSDRNSAWSSTVTFTVAPYAPTATPTTVYSPVKTVAVGLPKLTVTYPADTRMDYPRKYSAQVQFATDGAFTSNLHMTQIGSPSPTFLLAKTTQAFNADSTVFLTQGLWFVRFRLVDDIGLAGAWNAATQFVIDHKPTVLPLSPTNGSGVNYGATNRFKWQYKNSDPNDSQTKAQVQILRASDNTSLYNITQTGAQQYIDIALDPSLKLVPVTWQVRVWDEENFVGPWSTPWIVTFADQPVVSITSPAAVIANGRPKIAWTLAGSSPQKTYSATIIRQSDNKIIWSATGTTAQSVQPSANVLKNSEQYIAKVGITTQIGMAATSSVNFTTSYVPPNSPTYTVQYDTFYNLGYVRIAWSGTTPDDAFYSWVVYRQEIGVDDDWVVLYSTTDINHMVHHDWTAITGHTYAYIVAQNATRSGELVESGLLDPVDADTVSVGQWWLIYGSDSSKNFVGYVTGDSYSDEYEEETYTVIGRGRRREIGTHVGMTGSLTVTLKPDADGVTAAQKLAKLKALRSMKANVTLRDPFGSSYKVAIGTLAWQHESGYGETEIITATVPVDEVY